MAGRLSRWLADRPGLRAVAGNSFWLAADKVLRVVVWVVLGGVLARYLGPEGFGTYSYALAFALIFGFLASLGLETIVVLEIVREPGAAGEILGSAFVLRLAGGATAGLAAWAAASAIHGPSAPLAVLVAIAASAWPLRAGEVPDYDFQARVRSKVAVYAKDLAFLTAAVATVILVAREAPLAAILAMTPLEAGLAALFLWAVHARADGASRGWSFSAARAAALLRAAWPLALTDLAIVVYMRIDQVLLGQLAGFAEAGTYYAAARVVEASYLIPMALGASVYPALIRAHAEDPAQYARRVQMLYDLLVWTGIAFAVAVTLLAGPIVRVVYGEAFAESARILALQAWVAPVVFFNAARSRVLLAEGRIRESVWIQFIALPINLAVNLALIPTMGALGASIALIATAIGANVVAALFLPAVRTSLGGAARALAAPARWLAAARA